MHRVLPKVRLQVRKGTTCSGSSRKNRATLQPWGCCSANMCSSVDGIYGISHEGEVIVCGLARRPNEICNAFLYLKVKGEDLLLTPSLPDTYLQKSSDDGEEHSVQGINIK